MSSALSLLRHGEHVRPAYESPSGESEGAVGRSTAEERPEGKVSGILRRFKKDDEASYDAQALGWIKTTYRDAVEYAGLVEELEGYAVWGGAIALAGVLMFLVFGIYMSVARNAWFPLVLALFAGIPFAAYAVTLSVRLTAFKPADLPIIFDRKHRKVYRILREEQPGFAGLFKPWPIKCCEYEWDLIDAEYESELFTTGATVNRNHYLMFIVRKSAQDATIIDSFQIGNAMLLNEALVASMWEHIRRFLEQDGPHLPSRDEPLAFKSVEPIGWWEACGKRGVWGPEYARRWGDEPLLSLLTHLLFFVSIPANLSMGTGLWLAHKTRVDVDWPDEVRRRIGTPTQVGQARTKAPGA
jgi:hypothetical protein